MPYLLRSSGTLFGALTNELSVSDNEDFEIRFKFAFPSTTQSSAARPFGRIGGTDPFRSRVWMEAASSGNRFLFSTRTIEHQFTNQIAIDFTQANVYTIRRVSGVLSAFVNGVSIGGAVASTEGFTITGFFRNNTATYTAAGSDLYFFELDKSGVPFARFADFPSSGTQIVCQLGSSTINLSDVPAGNAQWVFYSSGASNSVTVSATLPKITGSLTLNEINPSYVISVNGQLPKITGAVALNEINPVFTVAVAGQLPKLTGSIALNQFANNRQVTVNGVLPKLIGAVTLNRIQPNNQAAVSGQLPKITASITLRVPDSYPAANPNDYTVSAYLSTDSTYTATLSESSTINAIISASSTFNARLN